MNKGLVTIILTVTTGIGAYVPVLFGADDLSGWSILGTLIGGAAGVWVVVWMSKNGY